MTAPALPDQLRADTVLGTLQAIIGFAEQGSDLRVTQATVTFSHAVLKSVGGSNPAFWILPADLRGQDQLLPEGAAAKKAQRQQHPDAGTHADGEQISFFLDAATVSRRR